MSFRIERNDIVNIHADAIVNSAHPLPLIGSGIDAAIYTAAGADLLIEERKQKGSIEPGYSIYTKSYNLKKTNNVKYIIHTVSTMWKGGNSGEFEIIRKCYKNSLQLAFDLNCKSVAVPLLATGNFEFPKDIALTIAIEEIRAFIDEYDVDVILVVYDKESFKISENFFSDIKSSIDEYYIGTNNYQSSELYKLVKNNKSISVTDVIAPDDFLGFNDFIAKFNSFQSFPDLLRKLIQKKGLDSPTVYKRSIIVDKKLFSKIMTQDHIPNKHSVMALGLALELDLPTYELLLATANVALNPFDMFDTVIKYCITKQIYDVMKIDTILFQLGLPCFN